jgi:2-polyprenyl-3-methyl-5-hydroxy-6-metoxy-1,4-benzoquinol methylase
MRIECPVLGQTAEKCSWISRHGSVRDNPNTGLIECQSCGLVTHANDLSESVNYESGTMHVWASGYGDNLPGPATDVIRRVSAIKDIGKAHNIESILDFGCGSGGMLEALSNRYEMIGIEPDLSARMIASQKSFKIYENANEVIENGIVVDMVTLFHVVEHFYNPTVELERIFKILKPNGLLLIETPNANDALLSKYENRSFQNFTYWSHHPMLHSHESLEVMVKKAGFAILDNQGTQRYDLNNHLYWLSKGLPGGHDVWKGATSLETNESYSADLVKNKTCDTLWLIAQREG